MTIMCIIAGHKWLDYRYRYPIHAAQAHRTCLRCGKGASK